MVSTRNSDSDLGGEEDPAILSAVSRSIRYEAPGSGKVERDAKFAIHAIHEERRGKGLAVLPDSGTAVATEVGF